MKISFIGVGMMGKGMAMNLSRYGDEFVVYARNPKALIPFEEAKISTTQCFSDVADADIICMCLPDNTVVEDIIFNEDKLFPHLFEGQTIIDFSTIYYRASQEIAKRLKETKGVEFLDAPVSGRDKRADDGTLTIMCGGSKELFDRMLPYLEYMGNNILYMGEAGSGQLAKAFNGTLFKLNIAGFCELLPLATKMGLDPVMMERMINTGVAESDASEFLLPRALERNFDFLPMQGGFKDLKQITEICEENDIELPTVKGAVKTYSLTMEEGYGELYMHAMMLPYEKRLGVEYKKQTRDE